MRPVANPPNPFVSQHCELLEPAGAAEVSVYEEEAKSILSENDSPDVPFRWSVNPYRGCQHACAYCYARPTHEYLGWGAGTDFDSRIVVKTNAAALLREAFSRRTWKREFVTFSGVTDCFQPLESVYGVTRQCLEVCREFANPIGVITKSFLVIRDIELLKEINRRSSARVYISIPFANDEHSRAVESGAPTPARRFEALRRLSDAGIKTGVMLAPIIPGLNDRAIPEILERAAAAGASSAGYIAVRLPGSVKEVFLTRMGERLPLMAKRIETRIRDMRGGGLSDPRFGSRMTGDGEYWDSIKRLFETMTRKYGINCRDREAEAADEASPTTKQLPLFE